MFWCVSDLTTFGGIGYVAAAAADNDQERIIDDSRGSVICSCGKGKDNELSAFGFPQVVAG